jgi:hypothetical protein
MLSSALIKGIFENVRDKPGASVLFGGMLLGAGGGPIHVKLALRDGAGDGIGTDGARELLGHFAVRRLALHGERDVFTGHSPANLGGIPVLSPDGPGDGAAFLLDGESLAYRRALPLHAHLPGAGHVRRRGLRPNRRSRRRDAQSRGSQRDHF